MLLIEKNVFCYCLLKGTGDGSSPKRRQTNQSSTVYFQRQLTGPTQTIESYQYYTQPSSSKTTKVTEETRYYRLPSQSEQNEITYSIQGTQSKFQPVSFLVTADQTQKQTKVSTNTYTSEAPHENPYAIFGTNLRTRPTNPTSSPSMVKVQHTEEISPPSFTKVHDHSNQ